MGCVCVYGMIYILTDKATQLKWFHDSILLEFPFA